MTHFGDEYRQAYASLGRPLRRQDGVPHEELLAAEKRLGVYLPIALCEYYRVAGRAKDFNCVYDRLLSPKDLAVQEHKLVFMEENQAVVLYSTPASQDPGEDPPVFMAANDDECRWDKVNGKCSVFLLVMLHWEAAFGGAMPFGGTAKVKPGLRSLLNRNWSFVGEVNRMRAYHKNGQALCFLKWMPEWRVFVGSQSEASLSAIAEELGLEWDNDGY
jgi:hypothetical protein